MLQSTDESRARANVLLVDDHPNNLLALRAILEPLGQNLVEARSGAEALTRLNEEPFAVILLDVQMPGMDGLETAILIKQQERSRHIPILFLTAHQKDDLEVFKGYSVGAVDYLIKPLNPDQLRSKVAVFIELHRRNEENRQQAEWLREKRSRDIDELVRANEQRYRALADSMPQIVWTASSAGFLMYRNRRWYECAGEDAPRQSPGWEAVVHPDDLARFQQQWDTAIERVQDWTGEYRFGSRKTGKYRWHLVRSLAVRDPLGHRTWIGTSTDIDDQKRAEESLLAASQAKDDFLAVLSHELRTPLNSILGWVQILQTRDADESERARGLATIERNARAQTQLIGDLLDVSRIVSGKLLFDFARTPLGDVVSGAVEAARPAALAMGVRLEVRTQLNEEVNADAERLKQVVGNLISNAIKFTPAGGAVRVLLDRSGSAARLVVEDEGCGIEPELLPHVFERFRQGADATTRKQRGLGLGLAIVKHIAEKHGGAVQAESGGPGKGSRFTLTLPLIESTNLPARESGEQLSSTCASSDLLRGVNVLLVEDDDDGRELIEVVLRDQGATVRAVSTATDALHALKTSQFDIMLSDIGLPNEDGYVLLARARRAGAFHLPAIALTAYASVEDRARALAAGFDSHVTKPVEPSALVGLVAALAPVRQPRTSSA